MKLETYECEFCGTKFPLVPIAFICPECGLRHFFWLDKLSCTNELFISNVNCPHEKTLKAKKKKKFWSRKKGPQKRK